MDRRFNKVAKAAHIKRNTEGTSNEISFSVLDAAKNRLDGGSKDTANPLASISLFTLHGKKKSISTPSKDEGLALTQKEMAASHKKRRFRNVSSVRPLSRAQREESKHERRLSTSELVAKRKARRKRSKFFAVLAISIAVVAGVGALGWWGYATLTAQQQVKTDMQSAYAGLADIDDALSELDGMMNRMEDDGAMLLRADDVSSLLADLDSRENVLDAGFFQAKQWADDTFAQEGAPSRARVAQQFREAVAAREQMLSGGSTVMKELSSALAAKEKAAYGWQLILSADVDARTAASLVLEPTEENIVASTEKAQQAADGFAQARDEFEEAASAYPRAQFSDYLSYIDKRVEALEHAIASNDAILAKDTELATAENDAYNIADVDAAEIASALPSDPITPISNVFESRSASERESYNSARTRVAAADAFISDYLGASRK